MRQMRMKHNTPSLIAVVLVAATVVTPPAAFAFPYTKQRELTIQKEILAIQKQQGLLPIEEKTLKQQQHHQKVSVWVECELPNEYSLDDIPGAVEPLGLFDPLGLGNKADGNTLKRYREAELTHGRVAMLAVVGFLVGEAVEGSSFLFDASISGPAIDHPWQVPKPFWVALVGIITKFELDRAKEGFVDPADVPFDKPGLIRAEHVPGDNGFDPLRLKSDMNPIEYIEMQNKELQNGRLAMIAAAGFLAQEAVDKKGILEHWKSVLMTTH